MSCLGECWDMGPPPDLIVNLPPPPVPLFLHKHHQMQHAELMAQVNATPCNREHQCEAWLPGTHGLAPIHIELPHKDVESWVVGGIDDTWLLVLVASSIGVLIFGALLAMFLLKCREMHLFDGRDSSQHRPVKMLNSEHHHVDCGASVSSGHYGNGTAHSATHGKVGNSDMVLYHGNNFGSVNLSDNRFVWATLTPRGTQHFISETYPRDVIEFDDEGHYEIVDYQHHGRRGHYALTEYEEPLPLIERYEDREYAVIMSASNGKENHNTDMRFGTIGSRRPMVSSPTRIENPNLPPLNLYPTSRNSTLKRAHKKHSHSAYSPYGSPTLSNALPKYSSCSLAQ